MTPWVLSDGTEVRLGGDVKGASEAARELRSDVARVRRGAAIPVQVCPPPGGSASLDVGVDYHVDAWIRAIARWQGVVIVSAPEVEYPDPYAGDEDEPGRIY
jgi:hypothetical protein